MALLAQHWGWLFTTPSCKEGRNILGKRRRWKEPPLCLPQPTQEKRLWSSLYEFVQGYYDNAEEPVKGTIGRLTIHLFFYDPVECISFRCWIPCPQLSHDGTSTFLSLSGGIRCGCSLSGTWCTTHRDPDTSASCPGQRHCGYGNL